MLNERFSCVIPNVFLRIGSAGNKEMVLQAGVSRCGKVLVERHIQIEEHNAQGH